MPQKILIVEDEPSIAENITYALTTEGFAAHWSATGQEALQVLRAGDVALIILDVGLPDVHGFELAREIRQHYDVPVIFVTARSSEIDRVAGLEIGADDYVVKPFSPRELSARVRAVLRRSRGPERPTPSHEPPVEQRFTLDEARQRLSYYGVPLELSRYEFRLLRVLVLHPGRVYSREQLMQMAWEEPERSLERTVDSHIKMLRQKLKAIRPSAEPIVTHRGVGYALEEES